MTKKNTHPKSLPYLFLTEMWERFGFYVVQGMLVLYMSRKFGFSDDDSYTIMGAFSALAYIAPFIGGYLAQRLLGFQVAIFWGGIILSIGYALLALTELKGFYISLATIIVGNGLFKPNISSLLGTLYEKGDPKRDSGFTLFYIGINIGALLAGVSSGYIKDNFGWHAGFALASIGLIFGLIIFTAGLKFLTSAKNPWLVNNTSLTSRIATLFGCVISIVLISFLLKSSILAKWLIPVAGIFLLIFLLVFALRQEINTRKQLFTLNILIISSIVFWMIYLQLFNSASLFIERLVNKTEFGFHIPTTAFYSIVALFIIMLGPGLAWSWQTLNQSERNPSTISKFAMAIVFVGLSALVLSISTFFPNSEHLINPLWIVLSYFLITVGEMLLSPIGLSAVTSLSPPNRVGMMMGVWFAATGFAGAFAGWLAKLASIPEGMKDLSEQLVVYRHAFLIFSMIAFGVAVVLFIMNLSLRRILKTQN